MGLLRTIRTRIRTKAGQCLMTAGRYISYTSIREQEADRKSISTALFSSILRRVCS